MAPVYPRAELYSSIYFIWYITQCPAGNVLICTQWPRFALRLKSTLGDLTFDMSHDTLHVTLWFCTQWPRNTNWANLFLSTLFIWYVTWYLFGNLFILQLMTPVYPRAELYSSRPFIWYLTRYTLGKVFILNSTTPVHPWAELYSLRPFIWSVTWYLSSIFFIFT
jgi:hypothetical protein